MLSEPLEGLASLLTTGKEDMPSFIIPMDAILAFPGEEKSSSQAHCEPLSAKLALPLTSSQNFSKSFIVYPFQRYNWAQRHRHGNSQN